MIEGPLLIEADRSISVAPNVSTLNELERIVKLTHDVPGVMSYTLGPAVGLRHLTRGVEIVKEYAPSAKVLYEHQRAGTHEGSLAAPFAETVNESKADAAVLFFSDNFQAQREWIEATHKSGLHVVMGPEISKHRHLGSDTVKLILRQAVQLNVNNIWVRGDDNGRVSRYAEMLYAIPGAGDFTLFIPRRVDETGNIRSHQRLDARFVVVIGRAVCQARDPRQEAMRLSEILLSDNS